MSLINDALKKAARQRAEDQYEAAPAPDKGGRRRIARHGAPMTVQTMVLLAAGAVTLIVASVVITGVLLSGKLEPKPVAAAKPVLPTPAPQAAPVIVVKVPPAPVAPSPKPTAAPPTAAPVVVAPPPSPTPSPVVEAPVVEAPVVQVAPTQAPKPVAVAPPMSHGEQVQSFIDKLRVTGVRAAGTDSKALVDGHVYRVNDILDRGLGIKLVQVDADHLTLVDSEGVTYVKNF
jgi:hypothetical protein